jgi:hypothetical protein
LVSKEGLFVPIGFGFGAFLMVIPFLFPQKDISPPQTENFSLNCSSSKVIPIYLQKLDNLNFYILDDGSKSRAYPNLSVNFVIKSPTANNVSFSSLPGNDGYSDKKTDTLHFIADSDGFYKLNFTSLHSKDCDQKKQFIILSG